MHRRMIKIVACTVHRLRKELSTSDCRRPAPRAASCTVHRLRLAVEAAEEIGHPELYPHLTKLSAWWVVDPALLERAIAACGPTDNTKTDLLG